MAHTTVTSDKQQFNKMLTAHCRRLITKLAALKGISEAALIEIVIREEANRQGIKS